MKKPFLALLALIVIAAAFSLGYQFGRDSTPTTITRPSVSQTTTLPPKIELIATTATTDEPDLKALQAELERTLVEREALEAEVERLTVPQTLHDWLLDRALNNERLDDIIDNDELYPRQALYDFLNLEEDQRATFDQINENMVQELKAWEAENVTLITQEDNKVKYDIPPAPLSIRDQTIDETNRAFTGETAQWLDAYLTKAFAPQIDARSIELRIQQGGTGVNYTLEYRTKSSSSSHSWQSHNGEQLKRWDHLFELE
ncbi:hypothetical protein [Cerasicoccus frondis]|uniref:hypothetical protein n=1 Tax=Cerasicoccus frondis TaxID=490090 RepID=UPI0028526254|nr:hypothetical protein [Cerasicoccus frondis]